MNRLHELELGFAIIELVTAGATYDPVGDSCSESTRRRADQILTIAEKKLLTWTTGLETGCNRRHS